MLIRSGSIRGGGEAGIDDLLRSCQGFRVDSPQGRLGFVESVAFMSSLTAPDALLVRVGLFARQLVVIPRREVIVVTISARQVVVRSHASAHSLSHLASAAATDECPEASSPPKRGRGGRRRGWVT